MVKTTTMQTYFIGTFLDQNQMDEYIEITADIARSFGVQLPYALPPYIAITPPFSCDGIRIAMLQEELQYRNRISGFPMGILQRNGLIAYCNNEKHSLAWSYTPNRDAKQLISGLCDIVRAYGIQLERQNEAVLLHLRSRLVYSMTDVQLFQKIHSYVEKTWRLSSSSFRMFNAVFFLKEHDQWIIPKKGKVLL